LGSKGPTRLTFSDDLWEDHEKVLPSENSSLIVSFTEDEIKKAVFSMNPSKAMGPDRFSMLFYQKNLGSS
jgi:hypothetical protein